LIPFEILGNLLAFIFDVGDIINPRIIVGSKDFDFIIKITCNLLINVVCSRENLQTAINL